MQSSETRDNVHTVGSATESVTGIECRDALSADETTETAEQSPEVGLRQTPALIVVVYCANGQETSIDNDSSG